MDNPSPLLRKQALMILERLEYFLDNIILLGSEISFESSPNVYEIRPSSMSLKGLSEVEDLYLVASFLKVNKIDIDIVMDLVNENPIHFITDNGLDENAVFATLTGKPSKIKSAINILKRKLADSTEKNGLHISYNLKIGKFTFNNKDSIYINGKQKDVTDYLVGQGINIKTSWDILHEQFDDQISGDKPLDTQKRSVATAVTNINNRTEKYLLKDKPLIGRKENEYWLQYKVAKGS